MNFTPNAIQQIMLLQFLGLQREEATAAPCVEALYPFTAEEVARLHFYKQDEGEGLWFRLYDDRVFNALGELAQSDDALYTAPVN